MTKYQTGSVMAAGDAVPAIEAHTLYRFWDKQDRLLYVGITADPMTRWRRHSGEKPWWLDVTRVTVEHFSSRAEVDAAETVAIQTENPQYNVAKRRPRTKILRRRRRRLQVTAAGRSTSVALYVGKSMAVVADGVADRPGGDVASSVIVETFAAHDVPVRPKKLVNTVVPVVAAADEAVRRRSSVDPALEGMAGSLVAMMWSGEQAVMASVGNSRIYLARQGQVQTITTPHTYDQMLSMAHGVQGLAKRLTRMVGGYAEDYCCPDVALRELQPGDRYLLCSDGLSSYVHQADIARSMSAEEEPASLAERLVGLALDHGGPDNVTVVVVDVW